MRKVTIGLVLTIFAVSMVFLGIGCKAEPEVIVETVIETVIETVEVPVEEVKEKDEQLTIGLSMPGLGVPYFAVYIETYQKLCDENGIELLIRDAEWDAAKQANQIDDLILQDVDVLVAVPADAAGIIPSIKKAKEAGLIVMASNVLPTEEGFRYIEAFTGPSCTLQGELIAQAFVDFLTAEGRPLEGNLIQITGAPGYSAAIDRALGFENKLVEVAPDINIIATEPGNWVKEDSRQAMEDLIIAHGDNIDFVYAHDDTMAVGAWLAIEAAGYTPEDIILIGIGGSIEGLAAVNDGIIKLTCLQSPSIDATLSVDIAMDLYEGVELEKLFNYMDSPIVTKDNVEQYLPGEW